MVGLYLFVSSALSLFHYAISMTALILPVVLLLVAIVVVKIGGETGMWFCSIAAVGPVIIIAPSMNARAINYRPLEHWGRSLQS